MTDGLVAFLRARLDEDEAAAKGVRPDQDYADSEHQERWSPARVLREVEAKRKILAEHSPCYPTTFPKPSGQPTCCEYESYETLANWPCPTVLALAAIWSDHPDYREEWRP